MKGSPAIGTRLLNGLELKHQSRFGLDCLNDHSIAEDLSRLLVERTSRGVEAFNCTPRNRRALTYGKLLAMTRAKLQLAIITGMLGALSLQCSAPLGADGHLVGQPAPTSELRDLEGHRA